MGSMVTLLVTFACTIVGMLLRPLLPQHHLRSGYGRHAAALTPAAPNFRKREEPA